MTQAPAFHRYTAQIDAEWEHLRHRPRHLAQARRWKESTPSGLLHDALADTTDLQQLVGVTDDHGDSPTSGSDADLALVQLIEIARHDQLAGRIVIQRLLPGLVARSARYRSRHDDVDPAEIVVAAGFIAVHRYDTITRPRYVAASLISDAVFAAFRQPLRKLSASERVVATELFVHHSAPAVEVTALERLADVVRLARAEGVAADKLDLIRELAQTGSPTIVAERRGVTTRTIRNHRDRAVDHIRRAIDIDALTDRVVVAA